MKKRYIKINDVSQIDTSRISVYDLNNRYVDRAGNIYGLKYNRMMRKVEVIKLERIHSSEMQQYQKKILINREHNIHMESEIHGSAADTSGTDDEIDDEMYFDPDMFIEKVIGETETHRERLKGIMMNITDSNIISRENKQDSTEFDDIARKLDIDGIQQIDKMEGYHRELTNYPRSITYYQSKIDRDGKHMLERLTGNNEKTMRFIYYYEMSSSIKRVYTSLRKHMKSLDDFISARRIDDSPSINKHHKQSYNDARTSIKNTLKELDEILKHNQMLYEYSCNPDNF